MHGSRVQVGRAAHTLVVVPPWVNGCICGSRGTLHNVVWQNTYVLVDGLEAQALCCWHVRTLMCVWTSCVLACADMRASSTWPVGG